MIKLKKSELNKLPEHTIKQHGLPYYKEIRERACMSDDELILELENRCPTNVNELTTIQFLDFVGPILTQILLDKYMEELKIDRSVDNKSNHLVTMN